jgi:hypothetical protein
MVQTVGSIVPVAPKLERSREREIFAGSGSNG